MKGTPIYLLVASLLICILFSSPAFSWLSKEKKEKLNELKEISKPEVPLFGKIKEPIKAGVSFEEYADTIYLNNKEEIISLLQTEDKIKNLSELQQKYKELQKEEIEGINFIQPSLELSQDEQKSIDEFFSRNEQEQLINLWRATIERNKTIQFIVQKLSPANSPKEANSLLGRTIGAAIFLPFYALQAITNNSGAYYGGQVGGRVLGSILEGKTSKNAAIQQLSQTEAIILFMMIDEVAERLRQRYHNYKRLMVERTLATSELGDAKNDNLDAKESSNLSAQILANIQRRSVEREIRKLDAEMRSHKNALIELAGPQAIGELDNQLKLELDATINTPSDF